MHRRFSFSLRRAAGGEDSGGRVQKVEENSDELPEAGRQENELGDLSGICRLVFKNWLFFIRKYR